MNKKGIIAHPKAMTGPFHFLSENIPGVRGQSPRLAKRDERCGASRDAKTGGSRPLLLPSAFCRCAGGGDGGAEFGCQKPDILDPDRDAEEPFRYPQRRAPLRRQRAV